MEVPGAAEGVRAALGKYVCWSPMERPSNPLDEGGMGAGRPPGLGRIVWPSPMESFDMGGEDRGQEESERARCVQAGSLRDPAAGGTGAVVGGVAGTEEVRAGEMGSTMGLKDRGKREKGGGNYGVLATRNPKS